MVISDSITRNNPHGTVETSNLRGSYAIVKNAAPIVDSQILH
jgi:hypothetical protein